jgi:hypothetical protein
MLRCVRVPEVMRYLGDRFRSLPLATAIAMTKCKFMKPLQVFPQARFLRVILALAVSSLPVATWSAEQETCVPREWTISIVDPNVLDADSFGADTSIFLDEAGRPRIFYAKGPLNVDDWQFKSAIQRSDAWRIRRLPADAGSPRPSVALDSLGRYHLAWRTGEFFGQGILHYARIEEGVWQEEIVDDTQGATSDASIAVDARGNPHIVYTPELAGLPMRYARWDGTAWQKEDIVLRSGILSPSIVLDPAGKPHVVYLVDSGAEVDYATRSRGVWTTETIDVVSPNQTLETSLVLDSTGRPHVAYDELFDAGINYGVKSGAGWSNELVDVGQRWSPALVLDSEDNPHMVFYDAEHGALIYATQSLGTWCLQTIEDDPNESIRIGRDPAIVLDGHGAIHVSYHYHDLFTVCQVKYAVSQSLPGQ